MDTEVAYHACCCHSTPKTSLLAPWRHPAVTELQGAHPRSYALLRVHAVALPAANQVPAVHASRDAKVCLLLWSPVLLPPVLHVFALALTGQLVAPFTDSQVTSALH